MPRKGIRGASNSPSAPPLKEPCALCGRAVSRLSKHHIIPKSEGGTETVKLCGPCHSTLHRFFRNRTLAREKNTLDALQADPDIQRYLAWVRKQPDRHITVRHRKGRM